MPNMELRYNVTTKCGDLSMAVILKTLLVQILELEFRSCGTEVMVVVLLF